MSYRKQQTTISRQELLRSVDSIRDDLLGIGTHVVTIESVDLRRDRLYVNLKGIVNRIMTKVDGGLYNGLIAACSVNDTDMLWSIKNDQDYKLMIGIPLRVKVDLGKGYGIVRKNDKYYVVDSETLEVEGEYDKYSEAKSLQDFLGRCWLNIVKIMPYEKPNTRKDLFG